MKLWFEGWNVNAQGACIPANATPAVIAALNKRDKHLANGGWRGDSAANNFPSKP
jgi:hypothetical protein